MPTKQSSDRHAMSCNRDLLNSSAPIVEVWIPNSRSPMIVEVFRLDHAHGPPSFEGIVFSDGRPLASFMAMDLAELHERVVARYAVFRNARRLPQLGPWSGSDDPAEA